MIKDIYIVNLPDTYKRLINKQPDMAIGEQPHEQHGSKFYSYMGFVKSGHLKIRKLSSPAENTMCMYVCNYNERKSKEDNFKRALKIGRQKY